MKNLIYINACMRAGSRTRRIATPIIEELSKIQCGDSESYKESVSYCGQSYAGGQESRYCSSGTRGMNISTGDPLEQATPYIKALSYLWGWGELTVISAQNIDYSSPEEIEERVSKAIAEGLEVCKEF